MVNFIDLPNKKMKKVILEDMHKCLGCAVCEKSCPTHAIKMEENNEGFIYPIINHDLCIKCNICSSKCPINNHLKLNEPKKVYASYAKDINILKRSSSGGVFSILALYVLNAGGIVYGASYGDNLQVKHIGIEDSKDLVKLNGSKYISSQLNNIYIEIKENLEANKLILFSGTPCQIAGLKSYLNKKYSNLITIDVICHGIPSQKLFDIWKKEEEHKLKDKITFFNFRSKKKEWGLFYSYQTKSGKNYYGISEKNLFYNEFLKSNTYRESCYTCLYAKKERIADITLGDYWKIEKYHPDFTNKLGVSLVLINSEVGNKLFDKIKNQLIFKESSLQNAIDGNYNLVRPSKRTVKRDNIYESFKYDYHKKNLKFIIKRYLKTLYYLLPYKCRLIIKKYIIN